jgi:hypothetical protein
VVELHAVVVLVARAAYARLVAARALLPCLKTHELVIIVVELHAVVVPVAKAACAWHVEAKEGVDNSGDKLKNFRSA